VTIFLKFYDDDDDDDKLALNHIHALAPANAAAPTAFLRQRLLILPAAFPYR